MEAYYYCLPIIDRISEEAMKKFRTYSKFSKMCGYSNTWWYQVVESGYSITYKTLIKVAKVLDLSVEYLLTGNDRAEYADDTSLEHICGIKSKVSNRSINAIKSKLRKGQQDNICLTSLFSLAEASDTTVINILKGDFND